MGEGGGVKVSVGTMASNVGVSVGSNVGVNSGVAILVGVSVGVGANVGDSVGVGVRSMRTTGSMIIPVMAVGVAMTAVAAAMGVDDELGATGNNTTLPEVGVGVGVLPADGSAEPTTWRVAICVIISCATRVPALSGVPVGGGASVGVGVAVGASARRVQLPQSSPQTPMLTNAMTSISKASRLLARLEAKVRWVRIG